MNRSVLFEADECLRWEGRPAPRCFTFRNWRHSLFGCLLLVVSVYWQIVGLQLGKTYQLPIITWIPLPVLLASLYLSVGHLLLARLEWERVFYAVTDRRIVVRRGLFGQRLRDLSLDEVRFFRLHPLGEQLGTVRIHSGKDRKPLTLCCIEHPRNLTNLLEDAVEGGDWCKNGD